MKIDRPQSRVVHRATAPVGARRPLAAPRAMFSLLVIALCAMSSCGGTSRVESADAGATQDTGSGSNGVADAASPDAILPTDPPVAGHHVPVYQGAHTASYPAAAAVGSTLGVAFVQDDKLRLALGSVADASAPVVVIDVPSGGSHLGIPLLTASPVGFDLVWQVSIDRNLFHVGFDATGRVVDPVASLGTGAISSCGLAATDAIFALACSDTATLRLCPRGGVCSSVDLSDRCGQPAVAWDGTAFDVAQSCKAGLQLTRVDASGQVLLSGMLAPTDSLGLGYTPGIVVGDGSLTIAYGNATQVATFDLAGQPISGPYTLANSGTLSGTAWHQVMSTTTGIVVATGRNANLLDGADGEADLYGLDATTGKTTGPIRLSHRPAASAPGLIATPRGVATIFDTGNFDLVRADFDLQTLDQPVSASFLLDPSGSLDPYALQCNSGSCYALAAEGVAGLGELRQAGIWRIGLDSGAITRPTATTTFTDRFQSVASASGPFGTALVAPGSGESYVSQTLLWFGSADSVATFPLPLGADHFYRSVYIESNTARLFREPSNASVPSDQLPFSGTAFGLAARFGDASPTLRCKDSYLSLQPSAMQLDVLRWRADIDDSAKPLLSLSFEEQIQGISCSDALIGFLIYRGDQNFLDLFDYNGQRQRTVGPLEWTSDFAASGTHIVLLSRSPKADGTIVVYDVGPDASVHAIALQFPPGTTTIRPSLNSGHAQDAAQVTDHQLQWLWEDSTTRVTYLSTWELP
jgi:hypothetical protein